MTPRSTLTTGVAACLIALGVPGMGRAAHAPEQDAAMADVALSVLAAVRETLPSGRAALDPYPFCAPRLVGWSCPAPLHEAVDELGFTLGSREFSLVCIGGPTSCRLVSARSLVAFDEVVVDTRTGQARVAANLWWRVGAGAHPVASSRMRFSLARSRGAWRITDTDR